VSPAHDILLFDDNDPIPTNRIAYGSYSVRIAEPGLPATATNPTNAMDVNDDNSVSPIDALLVINDLNGQAAAIPAGKLRYLDVSGDGEISPIDALLVINYLNRGRDLAAVAAAALDQPTESAGASSAVENSSDGSLLATDQIRQRTLESVDRNESLFADNAISSDVRSEAIKSVLDEIENEVI
jgi:hypothetical protein